MSRNTADAPTGDEMRNDGAVPFASQVPNDSSKVGATIKDALESLGAETRILVEDLDIATLNDEQTKAIGGVAGMQFAPKTAIVQCTGIGGTLAGDAEISIGITTGGTEILVATVLTALTLLNDMFIIDLSATVKAAIPANSVIFVKVTTKDTTATAGALANALIVGELLVTAT